MAKGEGGSVMSAGEYIREFYGVPAHIGTKVRYCGLSVGEIIGFEGAYLKVRFPDGAVNCFHPTWEIEYLEEAS